MWVLRDPGGATVCEVAAGRVVSRGDPACAQLPFVFTRQAKAVLESAPTVGDLGAVIEIEVHSDLTCVAQLVQSSLETRSPSQGARVRSPRKIMDREQMR